MPRPLPRRTVLVLSSALAVVGAGLAAPAVSSAAPGSVRSAATAAAAATAATPFTGQAGLFKSVGPTRIMDTRSGLGGFGTLGAARTVALTVAGTSSVRRRRISM